jgi:hypothetical protein
MPYRCYLAAEKFRRDIVRAEADARIASQLRPRIIGGGGGNDSDRQGVDWVAARARVAKAWQAIGPVGASVVSWCVVPKQAGDGVSFASLASYDECRGRRKGTAAAMLETALTRLADHYGLGQFDRPKDFS